MATVNASKYGFVWNDDTLGWMTARNATSGSNVTNQSSSANIVNVQIYYSAGGRGSLWEVQRSFFAFDVTAYQTGYTITDLKLYYLPTTSTIGSTGSGLKVALVKSTAQGNANTDLAVADFNNFDDTVDYAANDGTDTWRDLATLQYFDLNATAISAVTSTGYLKICIMDYLNDFPDTAPTANPTTHKAYCNFGTTPYLSFTATPIGYGNDVNGVPSANIVSIDGVLTANIVNVMGV